MRALSRASNSSVRLGLTILILISLLLALVPFTATTVSAQATKFQLVAFGVKTDATGTTVTDIGWDRGNSDKGWREGDWVPVKLVITNVQSSYPNLAGLPDMYIGFDFTSNSGSRFVDLIRGVQVGDLDLNDSQGWPQPDGSPYPTGNGSAPMPTLAAVHTAQTSTGENQWTGYDLLNLPDDRINIPEGATDSSLGATPGTTTDGKHQFKVLASEISANVPAASETIVIYFQAHLSRTFVWINGLESGYDAAPYQDWGGWLYGESIYTAPDMRNGSSYAPGSSGHMYVLMTGVGNITTQLPIPPKPAGLISGVKFNDLDADHNNIEAGEPELSGWRMHIWGVDPEGLVFQSHSNLTGSSYPGNIPALPDSLTMTAGLYFFPNLTEGTWYIGEHAAREVPTETGWNQTYPPDPDITAITIGSGHNDELADFPFSHASMGAIGWVVILTDSAPTQGGLNFGNVTYATKSGVKFEDLDADGVKDAGEPGLSGWTIYVDYNDNGALDAGEPSAVTGAGGIYTINNITPGTWKVREVGQAGWTNSFPSTSDAFGRYHQETFVGGTTYPDNDFGNWTSATKSGVKFEDLDADGAAREAGEPGLSGWTIFVDYDDDGTLDAGEPSAVTAADGTYTITGINPGTYKVREVAQAGWTNSFPALGYYNETFTSGEVVTGNDFGNWTSATKSGVKFNDKGTADGTRDADGVDNIAGNSDDEVLLAGWAIRAYADTNGNGLLDQAEYDAGAAATYTTNAAGAYTFTLNPGKYIVVEILQEKLGTPYYQSAPASAVLAAGLTTGTEVLGPNGYAITLTSSQVDSNNDFGNYWPHTTMDAIAFVWETTANGNVTLTLSDTNDGDVDLTNAHVHVRQIVNGVITDFDNLFWADADASLSSGNDDNVFNPGETWVWKFSTFISATTTFEVWGHGTDPQGNAVDYIPGGANSYDSEFDTVTVEVNLATRTQGFWATHLDFTTYVFNTYLPSGINLGYQLKIGTADVNSMSRLMGIFWANNAKNSDGKKRTALGQARETAANQALAAILNSAMPGGKPLPNFSYGPYSSSPLTIPDIATILSSNNINAIKALTSALDAFNNSGETVALDPGLPPTGKADPSGAMIGADIPWADTGS